MSATLPPWLSRLAAVLLAAALLAAAVLFGVVPLQRAYQSADAALRSDAELLWRYRRIAAQRPALEAQLEGFDERQASSELFLDGDTATLAAAALQDRINRLIDAHGGQVSSIQSLPAVADGALREVGLLVQFTGTIETVQEVLYAIETDARLLTFSDLDVRARLSRRRRRQASALVDPQLAVRMEIAGYLPPDAEPDGG